MRAIAASSVLLLLACSDALAPVSVGAVYQLRRINGQPLPWTTPPSDSAFIPMTVTEGWISFSDASRAQRHERFEQWVFDSHGDSTAIINDWTQTAAYQRLPGKIVLTYPPSPGGGSGADTLYLGPRGSLILRWSGYLSLSDSIVRHFCISSC